MFCPNCGQEQFCPCDNCRPRHKQEIVWQWVTPNGPVACGMCGLEFSQCDWEDIELKIFDFFRMKRGMDG